jgi:DNA-binding MarR family transcriptional regulator
MAAADDLKSPAISVMLRLLEREPMNMRRFSDACQSSPDRARKTLDLLEEEGLIDVERRDQGRTTVLSITLTAPGRDVANHFAAVNRTLEKLRAKRAA